MLARTRCGNGYGNNFVLHEATGRMHDLSNSFVCSVLLLSRRNLMFMGRRMVCRRKLRLIKEKGFILKLGK